MEIKNGGARRERAERKIELCGKEYLSCGSYAEYLIGRIRSGGVLNAVMRIYRKIRKYTLITAVIRGIAAVISLLEKSAVLLLFFSLILVLLPFALIPVTVCAVISIIGYFKMNGEVRRWITEADNVTVYITSERFFERGSFFCGVGLGAQEEHEGGGLLFARCAAFEAGEYTHPVIVVCRDPFLVARWAGLNLLLVKCDYFFILRRFYFNRKRVSYLVLS